MILGRPGEAKRVEGITNPATLKVLSEAGWVEIDAIADEAYDGNETENDTETETVDELVAPAANASRETWAAFAKTLGIEVTDEAKRDEIRELVSALIEADDDEADENAATE